MIIALNSRLCEEKAEKMLDRELPALMKRGMCEIRAVTQFVTIEGRDEILVKTEETA